MFISYAQNGEDVWLNRVFEGKNDGFYIDVGAHHPVFHSVTKAFYDRGWNGVNIEPIPELYQAFIETRQRDVNLLCACGREAGKLNLHVPPQGLQGVATLDAATAASLVGVIDMERQIPVDVKTLSEICGRYARKNIDFLKIDVEGFEGEVLAGMDFEEFRPIILIVEAVKPLSQMKDPVADAANGIWHGWEPLLMGSGYVFATFDGLNRYYVRKEDQHLVAKFIIPISFLNDNYNLPFASASIVQSDVCIKSDYYDLHNDELDNPISFYVNNANFSRDAIDNGIRSGQNELLGEAVLASSFSEEGSVFIDIGANLGLWSFVFASKGYEVFGFEGSSLNHFQLLRTNEKNSFKCKFLCIGVFEETGVYKFVSEGPYGHLENAFIDKEGDPIFCVSIDDWFKSNKFDEKVCLIKLDIEGAEIQALKGMKDFLNAKGYPPIFAESNAWCLAWNNTLPSDMLEEFEKNGYLAYKIIDKDTIARVESRVQNCVVENYLFLNKKSSLLKVKKVILDSSNGLSGFLDYAKKFLEMGECAGFEHVAYALGYQVLKQKELHVSSVFDVVLKILSQTQEPYNKKILKNIKTLVNGMRKNES